MLVMGMCFLRGCMHVCVGVKILVDLKFAHKQFYSPHLDSKSHLTFTIKYHWASI